jgi:hypothetical protein
MPCGEESRQYTPRGGRKVVIEKIQLRFQRRFALDVEEYVEDFVDVLGTSDQAASQGVLTESLRFVVTQTLALVSTLDGMWQSMLRADPLRPGRQVKAYLEGMREPITLTERVVGRVSRLLAQYTNEEQPSGSADQLGRAQQRATEIRQQVEKILARLGQSWSPLNREMVAQSRADAAAGRCEPVEDIIARVEAGGSLVQE